IFREREHGTKGGGRNQVPSEWWKKSCDSFPSRARKSNQRLGWNTNNKLRASSHRHPLSCFLNLLYSRIVETYTEIEATTKRLEITRLLVELIDATPRSIIDKVVYLTQGKLYPDFLGIELGVAEKLLFRALAKVTG